MKIQTLKIPSELMDNGLKDISLNRLSDLVLISGQNGAGKTRFLDFITRVGEANKVLIENYHTLKANELNLANSVKSNIQNYENSLQAHPDNQGIITELKKWKLSLAILEKWGAPAPLLGLEGDIRTSIPNMINFVPQSLDWRDNRNRRESQNVVDIKLAYTPGSETAHNWICSYIRDVCDKYTAATNPTISAGTEESRAKAVQSYTSLNEITKSLLGHEFKFSDLGRPILFGHHIFDAKLSDGQKVLLQLAVQIHAQADSMDDVIILLDEPENHLHPQACIDFIIKVRSLIPDNQLWISTHSIPILSFFFEESTLLFVNDGNVKYRGSAPEEVFKSLLGDDERVQKLRDFLGLPSEYAMLKYAKECLLSPEAHAGDGADDQGNQIFRKINEIEGDKKRVLDFGAGKGRILNELSERSDTLPETIDYVAYDKFEGDKGICEATISSIYGTDDSRYFNNLSEVSGDFENGSFDLVLMCNVLHEIPPSDWLSLFDSESPLVKLLKDEGSLLLVEDEEIPIGEKAYKQGFIVFGKAQLRTLFNIDEAEAGFVADDQRGDGRLIAHLIPKNCLSQITRDSLIAALTAKKQRAKEEIERLREGDASYKNGRKHGFWIQQYTNTSLVLDTLRN